MKEQRLFDASIQFGQFDTQDDAKRIASKNVLTVISSRGPLANIAGVHAYEDTAAVDDTVWQLTTEQQKEFYPFLDGFQTQKQIARLPANIAILKRALSIHELYGLEDAHAVVVATALECNARMILTLSEQIGNNRSLKLMLDANRILVVDPSIEPGGERVPVAQEMAYPEPGLEDGYQRALAMLQSDQIQLSGLHKELMQKRVEMMKMLAGKTTRNFGPQS